MNSIKVLIVEDELLIAEVIKIYLKERGHSVVGIAISYKEALQLIIDTKPDVVLLDVRLYGEKSGIDVASHLRESGKRIPYIIVSSQYDSNIIEDAMRAGAAGYITKPISKETLWSTIELAVLRLHDAIINDKFIDVKVSQGVHRIHIKDILYIKSDHVYVEIFCLNSKLLCRYSLREILAKIDLPSFVQCHRSYIINTNKIQKYSFKKIWINDHIIPVSDKYKSNLN
ncbi:MAG: response regulator transcription factor [Saprospiraceae bacterium]